MRVFLFTGRAKNVIIRVNKTLVLCEQGRKNGRFLGFPEHREYIYEKP